LHLESSKQNYYIISLRAIIKAILTSRPLHASTQVAAGTCTHLASYSVGVLLSPQVRDFLKRPQAQCTASRAACNDTCVQRFFEFQPSIVAADSSALFLLRVCFCLLIRDWKCSWTDGLISRKRYTPEKIHMYFVTSVLNLITCITSNTDIPDTDSNVGSCVLI